MSASTLDGLCVRLFSSVSNLSLRFSHKYSCHWISGLYLHSPGWSNLNILNLVTSTETFFPNKVTFTSSRYLDMLYSDAQAYLTVCNPMDCTPPGSSVHGIFQARILEWGAIFYSRGSSPPRYRTCTSYVSCIGRRIPHHQRHLGNPIWTWTYLFVRQPFNLPKYLLKKKTKLTKLYKEPNTRFKFTNQK